MNSVLRSTYVELKYEVKKLRYVLLIPVIWIMMQLNLGGLEGSLFPAVTPMQLTQIKGAPNGVKIWGVTEKLRPECNFRRVEWFLGERRGDNSQAEIFTGTPIIHTVGKYTFGPWNIDINGVLLQTYSYANIYHQCTIAGFEMPWLTKTRFWN